MDVLGRALRDADPTARLVEPRIVRRVLRERRRVRQVGRRVPHARCYWIDGPSLAELTTEDERGGSEPLPARVILVARPDVGGDEALRELWRSLFHARVHLALEARREDGSLDAAAVRAHAARLGQATFDEIRDVLRQDELLLPGADEVELWIEFAATLLELSAFEPTVVGQTFPALDAPRAESAFGVDARALLEATRPPGAPDLPGKSGAGPSSIPPSTMSYRSHRHLRVRDEGMIASARARGNVVRAALDGGESTLEADLDALAHRLLDAVDDHDPHRAEEVASALRPLARVARAAPVPTLSVEGRLLFDLQRACVENEQRPQVVDVLGAVASLFRRRVVRSLDAARPVRVVRQLRRALEKIPRTHLPHAERARVRDELVEAVDRADARLRRTLRDPLDRVLDDVGLEAHNVPERVARAKLVDELLDVASARGFLSIGDLRDAVSRNRLKCPDLSLGRFFGRDELLRADKALSIELDGVYRRGEIYLRALQKVSSLGFGTGVGRFLVMFLVLPVLASFVLLAGLGHLLEAVGHAFHAEAPVLLSTASLIGTSLVAFALLHSAVARKIALGIARGVGAVFYGVFVAAPRWTFSRPSVVALLGSRAVRVFRRRVLLPGLLAAPAFVLARRAEVPLVSSLLVSLGVLLIGAVVFGSAAFRVVEEIALDGLARVLRNLRKRILPGLFGFVLDAIRFLVEGLERGLYWVDEKLLFRRGESKIALALKGLFGAVWGVVSFVVRIYVNLLIEPQLNPIKHFPVVTVSHKIILPMMSTLIGVFRQPLLPLGHALATTVATATCFLLPGVFGFLAWELKENRRLYRAALPKELEPVRIGGHGETMTALLVPGFHSGTIPKLWVRGRRTGRRIARREPYWQLAVRAHTRTLTDVHHVEEAVAQFVERELVSLLAASPRWGGGPLHVGHVRLGSNRVTVAIHRGERVHSRVSHDPTAHAEKPCVVAFEEQSGFVLANMIATGFLEALAPADRASFADALAGLYRLADVDFVREEIEAAVFGAPYDVCAEGLVVWPGADFRRELVYPLDGVGVVAPVVHGAAEGAPLDVGRLRFSAATIGWEAWTRGWSAKDGPPLVARRVMRDRAAIP